ncbi:MAG: hypothetical protein AUK35_07640 [Zetaproteobacteria bacterium CG2_30_46_52]|nr:MAG: hypothetical protein AUK35_07640 [Zetaproteobacteria bacterium CG2_30_46_52]
MKCASCGTWFPDNIIFCPTCGELLVDNDGKTHMGDYSLEEKIGQGGIGVVFHAVHVPTSRDVAVKILSPESFSDEANMQRFRREMRLHATLVDPNIIEFIDIYEKGEVHALVMELLSGCNLKDYINHRGALPLGEVINITTAVLNALTTAHANDVIHRDLKPSNIFITDDGHAKLMDFGLAKTMINKDDITNSGMTVGTYLYMSPEQILGKEISVATDLYALGIVMFRMTTALLPFMSTGGGEFEIMEKQVRKPAPNPRDFNPEIPEALATLILHLLEKEPEKRPKNTLEVMARLEALGDGTLPRAADFSDSDITFSGLNSSVLMMEAKLQNEDDEHSQTATHNTLKSAFSVDSPLAPEVPPFDMRHPPTLTSETLTHLKTAIESIPPLPEVWHEVQRIFERPDSSAHELAKAIEHDAVLTAHVLKMCNTAAYLPAGAKKSTDVAIALTRMGMDSAQTLILSSIVPNFSPKQVSSQEVRHIWFHGQVIAEFAAMLAEHGNAVDRQSALIFGLLHDIGKLVILHTERQYKLDDVKQRIESGEDALVAEMEVLGYTHIDAGMMLALHWKLPRKLHRFIYYHHFPCWQDPQSWPPDVQAPIMLVHMAHLALSAFQHADKSTTVWSKTHRSHVKASESILYKPLHIPISDAAVYSNMRVHLKRTQALFPDLYPEAAD